LGWAGRGGLSKWGVRFFFRFFFFVVRRIFVEVVGAYWSGVGAPLLSVSVIRFACLFVFFVVSLVVLGSEKSQNCRHM